MPVTKQATKKVRQDKRKAAFNLKVKKTFKKAASDFRKNPTDAALKLVYKAADTAAKTNVLHKNRAGRIKSRLSKLIVHKTTKHSKAGSKKS